MEMFTDMFDTFVSLEADVRNDLIIKLSIIILLPVLLYIVYCCVSDFIYRRALRKVKQDGDMCVGLITEYTMKRGQMAIICDVGTKRKYTIVTGSKPSSLQPYRVGSHVTLRIKGRKATIDGEPGGV